MPQKEISLFSQAENPDKDRNIYTVSAITREIKSILEDTFGQVWVEGEVFDFRPHSSGHYYFSLKDSSAILPAAMFVWANKQVKFKIENGLKVICFGKVNVYEPHGRYQLIIEKIEPKGIGSLQLALEQLKQKLEKEGLFNIGRKRPIPYLPSRVGIVTSISGAAIKDILKVLERRFKDVHIIINSARVQGEGAREEIAHAINDFNIFNEGVPQSERINVMIIGRGGGSAEDLWAFNEEIVARAIYNSKIPVISAVGHERDVTIADLVADVRAATPSQAAEMVLPQKEDLKDKIAGLLGNLYSRSKHILQIKLSELSTVQKKLTLLNPVMLVMQYKEKVADLAKQIYTAIRHFMELKDSQFENCIEKLSSLSPLNILSRGYSITFKLPDNSIIKEEAAVKPGDKIKTRLHQGEILSQVISKNE